jgi:hypothetical protein
MLKELRQIFDDAFGGRTAAPQNTAAEAAQIVLPGDGAAERNRSVYTAAHDRKEPAEPLSARAQAELMPKIVRPAPDKLKDVPWPTPAQVRAFDARLLDEGYIRPEAALGKLRELDMPWTRLQDAMAEAARSQHGKYLAHVESIAKRVASGDLTVQQEDAWGPDEWTSDARERLSAFKKEAREIAAQAWVIAEPALLEKADFADEVADLLEANERPRWEQFAVPYRPPNYVWILSKYAETLRNGSRRSAGLPSSMLEVL